MRKTIVLGTSLILLQIPLLAYVLLQERTWGGPDRDGANGVAVASDGSVYVTGETRSFGAGGPTRSFVDRRTRRPRARSSPQSPGTSAPLPAWWEIRQPW